MDKNVLTNWTEATTNISKALIGLISCIEAGNNAWIEVRKNGEQDYPIQRINPLLDNPFNWQSYIGIPKNEKEMSEKIYLNETEKDLTYNWMCGFGTEEAIKNYQENNILSKELLLSSGRSHPIKIEDAQKIRAEIDNYQYGYWINYWKPKDNISYRVADDSINDVFTICYLKEKVDKKIALQKAGEFLIKYSSTIK